MEKITKCKTWFLQVQFFSAKACGELSKSDSWGIMRTWGLLLGAFSTCPSKLVNVKVSHSHFHELLRYLLIVELKMLTSESVKAEANETRTLQALVEWGRYLHTKKALEDRTRALSLLSENMLDGFCWWLGSLPVVINTFEIFLLGGRGQKSKHEIKEFEKFSNFNGGRENRSHAATGWSEFV